MPLDRKKRFDYYHGQTWQYWIGPMPPANKDNEAAITELVRVFQRSNKVRECVDRVVNGLVAKQYQWEVLDSGGNPAGDEIDNLLHQWLAWVDQQSKNVIGTANSPLWEAVRDLAVGGEGYLRLWMPDRLSELPEPWQQIMLSRVKPEAVALEDDDDGFIEKVSVQTALGRETQTLLKNGDLIVDADGDTEPITYPGLGQWLIFRMAGESLITEDVVDAQNAINLARTMEARSLIQNGFVERVIMNSQLPGRWVDDDTEPSGRRFEPHPDGLAVGPGRTSFLQGNPIYNDMGQISGYTDPKVQFNEPANLESYALSVAGSTSIIYHAMGQGHLLASDTQISGVSRQVLRADAVLKVTQYQIAIESALESILKVLLHYLGHEGLDVSVQLRRAIDFVSPEEKAQIMAEYNTGLLSKATAIAMLGTVDDADAELALIEADADAAMEQARQRITDLADAEGTDEPTTNRPADNPDPTQLGSEGTTPGE